jgi:hypothetical protein
MKKNNILNSLTTFLFYISIFLFFLAFNFQDSRTSGWYQQFLPTGLPNFQVSDVFFLDSLKGWLVSGNTSPNDSSGFILKTTNGGDNWNVLHGEIRDFTRVKFLNVNTGFVCGGYYIGAILYKTTNGGNNWFALNIPGGGQIIFDDMSVLNEDTIWLAARESLIGGVFRTTNGGVSWTQQFGGGTENPNKIYMFNARIGFITNTNSGIKNIRKTTNSGISWNILDSNDTFRDIYFIDSMTGWKARGDNISKTINGGINWIVQNLPTGGNLITGIYKFTNINKDSIWGTGGSIVFPPTQVRGIQYRTTNSGLNWFYQIPDTSIYIPVYYFIKFVNKFTGWTYGLNSGIHTVVGGDTTFLSSLPQISNIVPNEYRLYQNYPNPFNSMSNVKFQMLKRGFAEIKVFDITGKLIKVLMKQNLNSGDYSVSFDAGDLTSGIYFYSLFVDGIRIDTKKAVLIK